MSPRPKKASDEEVFAAALRAMSRLGPTELTLADIAQEAGLTAGALVQRFGSKRALQLTMAERLSQSSGELFAGLAAATTSPLDALYAYGDCMAQMAPSPDAMARSFAWLLQDLTDPDLRQHTLAHAHATRRELRRLAQAAIAAGELRKDADPGAIARALETIVGGSLIGWAFYQEGTASAWVRQDVDGVLAPWRRQRRHSKGSHVSKAPKGTKESKKGPKPTRGRSSR